MRLVGRDDAVRTGVDVCRSSFANRTRRRLPSFALTLALASKIGLVNAYCVCVRMDVCWVFFKITLTLV